MEKIIVIGAGGLAREVRFLIEQINVVNPQYEFLGYLVSDLKSIGEYDSKDEIIGDFNWLSKNRNVVNVAIGIGNPNHRLKVGNELSKHYQNIEIIDLMFPKDKIIIGYSGSFGITNALGLFINTIKQLNKNLDIYFVLVGSGDLKNEYIKQLSDCNNVVFLPRIEQNQVKYILGKCDILYLSTKYSKVWQYGQSMNKVVEYMLAGKPIIASYSGYQSMINESKCGVFVKDENEIELINTILHFSNMRKTEREKIGKNGKNWIYDERVYSVLAIKYINEINLRIRQ